MVALNFNASQVKPNTALEPVPTGQYPVIITRSEEKPTKKGDGSYIEFEMTIQGGEFNGRKVFDRLNIRNPNQQAVDIAYATLSAICHVTGRLNITATEQLHGVPFVAVVSKLPRNDDSNLPPDQQRMTNEVKGYKDINGNDPGFAGTIAQPGAAPQWANGQSPNAAPAHAPAPAPAPAPQPQPQGGAPSWAQPQAGNAAAPTTAAPAANNAPPAWAQPQATATA